MVTFRAISTFSTENSISLPSLYLFLCNFLVIFRIFSLTFLILEIYVAGEQLVLTPSVQLFVSKNRFTLYNHYGPSESHVVTSYVVIDTTSLPIPVPIGSPIYNTSIFILDNHLRIVPIGIEGEIFISGYNLAKGIKIFKKIYKLLFHISIFLRIFL